MCILDICELVILYECLPRQRYISIGMLGMGPFPTSFPLYDDVMMPVIQLSSTLMSE